MARMPTPPKPREPTLTEKAIEAAILADGGNRYRELLQKWLPRIEDAYRQDDPDDVFRSHLGASLIGRECARELWYKWRWVQVRRFPARILRLFNRGHREEANFLAMLEMIGVHIHQQDDGGQERISDHGGHFGSALDGVLYGVPDCPGEWLLGEFKTFGTKPFVTLVSDGVLKAKPEHYAQVQTCMARRGIHKTLYMAVNKNDDDLYCEIIEFNEHHAGLHLGRARDIIFTRVPPAKLSEDPSHFKCSFCDERPICHYKEKALVNCRTCKHSAPHEDGTWWCEHKGIMLDKADQKAGCPLHELIPGL